MESLKSWILVPTDTRTTCSGLRNNRNLCGLDLQAIAIITAVNHRAIHVPFMI